MNADLFISDSLLSIIVITSDGQRNRLYGTISIYDCPMIYRDIEIGPLRRNIYGGYCVSPPKYRRKTT